MHTNVLSNNNTTLFKSSYGFGCHNCFCKYEHKSRSDCVHEHAAERNANVCLNCKGREWERKIMNKENKLVIRIPEADPSACCGYVSAVCGGVLAGETGTGRSPAVLLRRFPGNDDQRGSGCGQNETRTEQGIGVAVCKVVYQCNPW